MSTSDETDYDIFINHGTPPSWMTMAERLVHCPRLVTPQELLEESLREASENPLPPVTVVAEYGPLDRVPCCAVPFSLMSLLCPPDER